MSQILHMVGDIASAITFFILVITIYISRQTEILRKERMCQIEDDLYKLKMDLSAIENIQKSRVRD